MDPFVVIGGDAAGMSAASKARREAPDREIVVFERGEWVSYGACGLPYYVKGEIASLDDLVAVSADRFRDERDIDLRTESEVVAIDTAAQTVTVESEGDRYDQSYGDLLIATGASAIEPPIDGIDRDDVLSLHDLPDGRAIRERLESGAVERVAVVGGGYVGVEMAEAFDGQDCTVDLYEMREHVLEPFGPTIATQVEKHLREQGIGLHLGTTVEAIDAGPSVVADERRAVDLVLVAAGVTPNAALAADAGIAIGETGAIATDRLGRTDTDRVYAAGDCAEADHTVTGNPTYVPLALTANRAGRAIGTTVAGDPTPVGPTAGTAVLKAFDLEVARTGVTVPERARAAGFDPASITIDGASRAGYYPGGSKVTIELWGDRASGRVLGASMVGREGVAKRIDPVATALHTDLTATELSRLDLSYAPPFGPTWDPVLTAGKVLASALE
ncbi:FAD-dependent oxidoreductase [Halococcoides cellulosivorans]|uniref:Pyridine nucleotide-disulfide oxidoreductase n=1 Tax=Halococcoides cellulosivorans TaxID=1679096 RepID=A0A2R4WZ92_9EURY|nr:FAD-dependent oxidoreductase [Halococcoides cellulosivorans]AWB26857.1 pyridine nucleotide-disulfide oxidoreductase [Halococcoides cellulosivorans]